MQYMIISLCIAALLAIYGLFLRKGKGLMLLAGYNTLPREEREKLDNALLGRLSGNMMLRLSCYLLLLGAATEFRFTWGIALAVVALLADCGFSVVRMQKVETASLPAKKQRAVLWGALAIVALSLLAIALLGFFGNQSPEATISEGTLTIPGMYGLSLSLDSIQRLELTEQSMREIEPNGRRDNGFGGLGNSLKGHFSSEKLGKYLLFVQAEQAPTLHIVRGDGTEDIYLSLKDPEQTRALYRELEELVH